MPVLEHHSRTLLSCALVTVVAVRVSAGQPLADSLAATAADPRGAWRAASNGWDVAGQLGSPSAQGLRETPFIALYRLADTLGLGWQVAQTGLRTLVLLVALLGALRLLRRLSASSAQPVTAGGTSWLPWFGAIAYAANPVLVATSTTSPPDAVALAALPWAVAPLVAPAAAPRSSRGWLTTALWVAVAGVASPPLAATVLVAVLAVVWTTAGLGRRARLVRTGAYVAAAAWWLALVGWEWWHRPPGLPDQTSSSTAQRLADVLGEPGLSALWLPLVVLAGLATALAAVLLRPPGVSRRTLVALLALSVAVWGAPGWTVTDSFTASVGLQCLAGLIAWVPFWSVARDHPALARRSPGELVGAEHGAAVPALALLVVVTTVAGLVVAAGPKAGQVAAEPVWAGVPDWVGQEQPERVLVLPPAQDRSQAAAVEHGLGHTSWVGRDRSPVGTAYAQHAVDRVTERLMSGHAGPGTLTALQRLGVSHVLLRGDLPLERDLATPLAPARSALVRSGASLARAFGGGTGENQVDYGVRSDVASLEVWRLPDEPGVLTLPGDPVEVAGGPGAAAALRDAGVLAGRGVRLTTLEAAPLVSDEGRRQDVDLTTPWRPRGETVQAADEVVTVPDGSGVPHTSSVRLDGATRVWASSNAAAVGTWSPQPSSGALGVLDGNPFTSWRSQPGEGVGEFWEVRLDDEVEVTGAVLQLQQLPGMPGVTQVRLDVGEETIDLDVPADGRVEVPAAPPADRVRVTVTGVAEQELEEGQTDLPVQVGIAELTMAGVEVERALTLEGGESARAWLFSALRGNQAACVPANPALLDGGGPTVCHRGLPWLGEDTGDVVRVFRPGAARTLDGRAVVVALPGPTTATLVEQLAAPSLRATSASSAAADLRVQASAAVDGDPTTSWRAAPGDLVPALTVAWETPTTVQGVAVVPPAGGLSALPDTVEVTTAAGQSQEVRLEDGRADLSPVLTDRLTLTFPAGEAPETFETSGWVSRPAPLAIAEVRLEGAPAPTWDGTTDRDLGCGSGPDVEVAGVSVPTAVTASADDLVNALPVVARLCQDVVVADEETTLRAPSAPSWLVHEVLLVAGDDAPVDTESAQVTEPATGAGAASLTTASRIRLSTPATGSGHTLAAPVPVDSGWRADVEGERLRPVTLDGWSQGWLAPPASDVVVRYAPGSSLRLLAATFAFLWLLLALLAALRVGRGLLNRAD